MTEDYFGQTLCIGDRVAFVTANGQLKSAQIVDFTGEDPYRIALLYTDGRRRTQSRCNNLVKEP